MGRLETKPLKPYGVNSDLSPIDAGDDVWNEARGVIFRDRQIVRAPGYQYRTPAPLYAPEAIHFRKTTAANQWLYAGADGVGLNQGGAAYDITPASFPVQGVSPGRYNWCSLNDVPVLNHREIHPLYHDGVTANPMVELPNWPATWTCRVMRSFKFFLLAIAPKDDVGEYLNQIRWSSSADVGNVPAEWIPGPTNDAGDLFLADEDGEILDAVHLGNNLIVYKGNASYFVQYLGGVFQLAQRSFLDGIGLLTTGCAVEHRNRHYVVTEGDVVVHDGNQAQSIASGRIQNAIFGDFGTALRERAFAYLDHAQNSFTFLWPSAQSSGWCDRRATYLIDEDVWSIEGVDGDEVSDAKTGSYALTGLGNSWAEPAGIKWSEDFGRWSDTGDTGVDDQTLLAFADAVQFGEPTATGKAGATDIMARLVWSTKALDRADVMKLIDCVWLLGEAVGPVTFTIRVGFQETPNSPTIFANPQTVVMDGTEPYVKADILREGRYITIEVVATSENQFTLNGMLIDYQLAGPY